MSGQKTLIWAVILLGLGAFYYFYEVEGGKKRDEVARQLELLFQFTTEEVTSFTVKRAHETIRAEKRDGQWYLTEPLAVRGDAQKYGELARFVADLRHVKVIEEQAQTLEPFGLTTPQLEIQVGLKNQTTPLGFRLGGTNPTGGSYYAQVEGRPTVYLVGSMVKDALDMSLQALRDKTLFAYAPADVQEVQLAHGTDTPIVLQRQSGESWSVVAPLTVKADDQQVRSLLQRLHDTKIQAFVSENATDLAPYGLQEPTLRLQVKTSQGVMPELLLGTVEPDKKGVYGKRSDTAQVFLLPQELWDNLPKTLTAVRDKTLLHFEREQITRLELHAPAEHIVIQNTGPRQYVMEQPMNTAGDGEAIYSLLWDLHDLKAKEFVVETPVTPERYGLEMPRLRILLAEKLPNTQDVKQHVLLLGGEAPDAQGVYAKREESPTIYLVDYTAAQRIFSKTVFELRNRKLITFAADTIHKLRLQYPSAQLTIERQGTTWKLLEPEKQTIPQHWKVDHMLYELQTLEYAKIVDETVQDRPRYGLDTPPLQVTLWQRDGTVLGPLTFGQTTHSEIAGTETVYAQVGTQTALYALKTDFLKSLPKTPSELMVEK